MEKVRECRCSDETLREGDEQRGYKPRRPGNVTRSAHKKNDRTSVQPCSPVRLGDLAIDDGISDHWHSLQTPETIRRKVSELGKCAS